MHQTLREIHQSLQKLIGLHRQLVELLRAEREAIAQADLKGIQDATYAKAGVIESIRQAEHVRIRHIAQLATEWKKPVNDLVLTYIIMEVEPEDDQLASLLRSAFNALTTLIKRAKEQNTYNAELIERSLSHVSSMKQNVLGESRSQSSTYTARARRSGGGGSADSRLLSTEA